MERKMYLYFLLISIVTMLITSIVLVFLFYNALDFPNEPTLHSMFLMILPAIGIIFIFIIIFIYILSLLIFGRIIAPIKAAADNIESILNGQESEEVEDEFVYDELKPFVNTIKVQKEEIISYIDRLVEAEKIRSEFTANVSHELKTPLTSINGYAEMIASGITTKEDSIEFANIINKEGLRLLELIDDIINLSKLESFDLEEMGGSFESVDIYELAENILINQKNRASERNIILEIKGRPLKIHANKRMIEDLLSNLIDNAIKYNKEDGRVIVDISKESSYCILKVKDTGIGISQNDQQRIFERFYRADKSRSKKISGTGIGLSIVKHIVEKHKGEINLKSKPNIGTEIEVILPF